MNEGSTFGGLITFQGPSPFMLFGRYLPRSGRIMLAMSFVAHDLEQKSANQRFAC